MKTLLKPDQWETIKSDIFSNLGWIDDLSSSEILVSTTCVYPSGDVSQVSVSTTRSGFRISDGARGLNNIRAAGIRMHRPGVYLSQSAQNYRVEYRSGDIFKDVRSPDEIGAAVVFVSNASVEAVRMSIHNQPVAKSESFKFAFNGYINEKYPQKFIPEIVQGRFDRHKMDYVNMDGRIFVLDPVTNDKLTFNAAFRAHSDFGNADRPDLKHWIVYDEGDAWSPSQLRELESTGALVVDYEGMQRRLPSELAA